MTQKAAICLALLRGEVLSIMTAFKQFNCTNLPREISRSVEKEFGVTVSKVKKVFVSTYGESGFYYQYRLNQTTHNEAGRQRMIEYVNKNGGKYQTIHEPETNFKQTSMF